MKIVVSEQTIYSCSLERAFKTPMLSDVGMVHTGFGPMPRVTHTTEDEHWGKPGYRKKIFMAGNWFFPGGEASSDIVLIREENKYWKIEVADFKFPMLGFNKFTGEWRTTELQPNQILIQYTYTLHSDDWGLYPLQWLFARLFWSRYMRQVLENIRNMIRQEVPYLYP